MLTRPGVLQWFFIILEPQFVIPKGAPILEPSNLRVCALYVLTWKCASRHNSVHFFDISTSKSCSERQVFLAFHLQASRHNGVQFFISHLSTWLRTRRFSEPTFRPFGATNHLKNTVNRDLFAHLHLLSSHFFSSLIFSLLLFSSLLWLFPPLLFHLSTLLEVWLLNFLRLCVHVYTYIHLSTNIYIYTYVYDCVVYVCVCIYSVSVMYMYLCMRVWSCVYKQTVGICSIWILHRPLLKLKLGPFDREVNRHEDTITDIISKMRSSRASVGRSKELSCLRIWTP